MEYIDSTKKIKHKIALKSKSFSYIKQVPIFAQNVKQKAHRKPIYLINSAPFEIKKNLLFSKRINLDFTKLLSFEKISVLFQTIHKK